MRRKITLIGQEMARLSSLDARALRVSPGVGVLFVVGKLLDQSETNGGGGPRMKHPFDVHVGERIRQSRCNADLSERALGLMLGVSTSQIHALEAGVVRVDSDLIRQVVDVLNVPAAFYFEGLATALQEAA